METLLTGYDTPGLGLTVRAVMTLALPAIIEQIMITMVQYVDTAMVGSLGSQATAAVGLTSSTTWLIGGILSAAAVGFSVQVAQYVGAGKEDKARAVTGQAMKFTVLFGLLITVLAVLLSGPLPRWLNGDSEIISPASAYFRIYAYALPFNFCVQMLSSIIRCAGDTRTPMRLNLSINLLNMIFNFLLIYPTRTLTVFGRSFRMWGADLGVQGAAWGSFLALLLVSAAFLAVYFTRESAIRPKKGERYPFEKACLSTTVRLGIPVALERCAMSMAQIVITALISKVGVAAVAANHLAVTAESISYMPAYGVAAAATTMVGQALGAKRKDLARKFSHIATWIGVFIMTCGGLLLYLLADPLIRLFTPDTEVIELGRQVLRIVSFAEPFFGMSIVVTGALRGAGDTKAPFILGLISMWGVRITLSMLLVGRLGLAGAWVAMAVELGVRGVLFLIRMLTGRWLEISLFAE